MAGVLRTCGHKRAFLAGRSPLYCGPALRHPAELLPAVDLGGRVWLGGRSCKGGPAAPAFGGDDTTCHPAIVCHQEFDGKARLKCNASAHAQAASFRSAVVFGSSLH